MAVAQRPSRQELAVELLEAFKRGSAGGRGGGLGFSAGASFSFALASAASEAGFAFFGFAWCVAGMCRFGRLGGLLFVRRLLCHRAHLLSILNQDRCHSGANSLLKSRRG